MNVIEVRFLQQQSPPGSVQLMPYFVATEKLSMMLVDQGVLVTHTPSNTSVLYPMHIIARVTLDV